MKPDGTPTHFVTCQPSRTSIKTPSKAAIYQWMRLTAVLTILAAALMLPTPKPQRIYCPDRLPLFHCQPYPPTM